MNNSSVWSGWFLACFFAGCLILVICLAYPGKDFRAACQEAFHRAHTGTDSLVITRRTKCTLEPITTP